MKRAIFYLGALIGLFLMGCNKESDGLKSELTVHERINKFIVEVVHTYYLWENKTDWKQYENRKAYQAYTNHYELFEELLHEDDYWSTLTDDIAGMESQFSGVSTTFGYTLSFWKISENADDVVAVVLFTTSDSPAAKAGLKRGDVIIEMNGNKITADNYRNLYYAPSLVLRCGALESKTKPITFVPLSETISLNAIEMYENPVNFSRVIERSGKKIGYLSYTGYQMESEVELIKLFTQFKSDGVQDVVLDLRYNPGGYSRTSLILSSILAPESVVKNKRTYLIHHYNTMLSTYYRENNYATSEKFLDTVSVNMDLSRLYVLTSGRTASASEATMVGLDAYLDVIQIGEATSGKYCGGILLSPEDQYGEKNRNVYESFSNWGMYIMIYRFANINGISSFTGGLEPDIQAEEDDFDLKPFGDETDPLLGRALAHIMGEPYIEQRAAKMALPFIPMPALKKPVDGLMIAPTSLKISN